MAPDRMQLRALSKENNESFRRHAQRWRELAAYAEPPLLDKELTELFRDALQSPYFERMISSATSDFTHLVTIGERVESVLKSGRIQGASSNQAREIESLSDSQKEEDDEINAIMADVGSGSSLLPFDLEIERTARALKEAREVSMDEGDPPILSSNSKEEDNMATPQPLTMGNYCKQTDE
ncbi:uncharacterized protein LOC127080926 [Lathyrus oleraceus]|uniref:uncharacterized protein LOC127080926 n=1 Tax=Pisum sativum TaxID=3888 RepID=UPI0021D09CB6|nr:uncharacterized protein LOC127080926 [Pisum sativum]